MIKTKQIKYSFLILVLNFFCHAKKICLHVNEPVWEITCWHNTSCSTPYSCVFVCKVRGDHVRFEMSQNALLTKGLGFLMITIWILTSSSLEDVEGEQECKHVASALDITWLQTHGHKQLTVGKHRYLRNRYIDF